ncbi:MAG: PilZ domain-containing protein, partial [Pseudomonadota bacterium]
GLKALTQHDGGVSVFEMSPSALRGSDLALVDSPAEAERDSELRPLADDAPGTTAAAWEDVGRGLEIAGHEEPTGPITKRNPPEHWQVDDIGAGGVRLCLDAPQQPLLIGDLVGLRAVDGHRWTVGVLRWIRFDDQAGNRISIGVEFLANRCLPMQVQDFRNGIAAGVPQPGLFAPQRTDADGAALFLPAQVFDHEKRVVCWLNGRARVLELDSERTGTTLFTEVGCRMTALEVGTPAEAPSGTETGPALANDDGLSFTSRNCDDQAS